MTSAATYLTGNSLRVMAIFNRKRRANLPTALLLEHDGQITLIKKVEGSSDGRLRHLIGNAKYSDEESLQDAIAKNQSAGQLKPRPA